ncbi:hypothetical protein ACOSP7_013883 [Xanthoceras sorbifolium]
MSTNEADLGEGSVGESLEDVEESQDHMEEGDESGSSSSSDATIESQYNRVTAGQNLNQFVPAILRRAVVPFNANDSATPISIAPAPLYLPPPPMRMGAPRGSPLPYQPDGTARNYNNNRMRMNWVDNILPASNIHQVNWIPEAQNFVIPAAPPNPRRPTNSVYDPLYETMGLPVDPHLRMFLASRRDNADN